MYNFENTEVAMKIAETLLSCEKLKELGEISYTAMCEGLVLALSNLHREHRGCWNEESCEIGPDGLDQRNWPMTNAVDEFLVKVGVVDKIEESTHHEAEGEWPEVTETWFEYPLKKEYIIWPEQDDHTNNLNPYGEYNPEIHDENSPEYWYSMFPDGYVGDGITVEDMLELNDVK